MAYHRKTPEEVAFLKEYAPWHSHAETISEFENRFGAKLSPASLASWMHDNGVRVRAGGCRRFTDEERSFLVGLVPGRSHREIAEAFGELFPPITVAQVKSFIANNGLTTGRTGRFERGSEPANKGKTWDDLGIPPETRERMLAMCFRAGDVPANGRAVPIGLAKEMDFTTPEFIESHSDGDLLDNAFFAHSINQYRNLFGKSRVIVIKSQMGQPLCAYSGDEVYWEVCQDLPKTTKLMVDGKALYVHRANFQIIDKDLI